jgi:hypothetical protein
MTERADDTISQSSTASPLHVVGDEPNSKLVNDPVLRTTTSLLNPEPTTPVNPIVDVAPPVKEGYNYWNHLPYTVEDENTRIAHLDDIIKDLYTCIRAGDFEAGARIASRQIKRWLHLKFKMPKETRKKLINLYYELSLTPGIDPSAADTFANMFKLLASYSQASGLQ